MSEDLKKPAQRKVVRRVVRRVATSNAKATTEQAKKAAEAARLRAIAEARAREVERQRQQRKVEEADRLLAQMKAQQVVKHTVGKGDTLSHIAKKYYGDAHKYMIIYEANKDVIGPNPDIIRGGMELIIPPLEKK